uniref:Leucine-rich repeat-containing N-terminal plant-type domain-containing protein n=1 Tax=Populus trichocarpa TaxID=3694 RepID=A0A2K1YM29_POPTR
MWFSLLCLSQSLSFILSLFHFHSTISSPLSSNHSSSSSSSSSSHLCAHHQSHSLLHFKQSFSINRSASLEYCQYPFPKTESWIDSTDCCSWDGVTCDMKTRHVTGLDLSCSIPYGTLLSNSTLFLPASSSKARPL